jgi:hypothetical protein
VSGKDSREAIEVFAHPIQQTLKCITSSFIGFGGAVSPFGKIGTLHFLPEANAVLNGTKLRLFFSQRYESGQDSKRDQLWRVRTRGYIYTVNECKNDSFREIFSYQWHPDSKVVVPHVHFKEGEPMISKAHLPTGRISVESLVEFLIEDLGVKPASKNWKTTITHNRDQFERQGEWV